MSEWYFVESICMTSCISGGISAIQIELPLVQRQYIGC